MKKIITLFLVLLCFSVVLFGEEIRMAPLGFPSTASNGMGGPHTAYTSDIYALFVNPAALQWANQTSVFELSGAFTGPLNKFARSGVNPFSLLSSMQDNSGEKSGISNPFGPLLDIVDGGKLPLGTDLRGPVSAGYTANGLGFGFFSRAFVDAQIIGTDVDASFYGDFMLPFGMSFNILKIQDHELAAGFVLKPFVRVLADLELSALDLVNNSDFLTDTPIPLIGGLGNDLGLMYRFKRDLALGLTLGDVYTFGVKMGSINGVPSDAVYRVPLSLNLGAAYTFRLASVWKTAPKVLQSAYIAGMADWSSMNNIFTWNDRIHRNPILDLGLGAEFGFFNFLKLRLGLHEMLPMIGLGLEPRLFKFNIALYGKELGNEPGINSTMGLDISMAFRLDTKKKNWPWSKPLISNIHPKG